MNFLICAIIKNENLYLREWIDYHLNLGFEKIILYDNNDVNGEVPNMIVQDYINKNVVEVINYRGFKTNDKFWGVQSAAYNDCLQKYKNTDNWIAFIDVDEFIFLEKHKKIQYLFENSKYNNYESVVISWLNYGDNGQLYYENKPVLERFTTVAKEFPYIEGYNYNTLVKSITKSTDNTSFGYANAHCASTNCCNSLGNHVAMDNLCNKLGSHFSENIYIKHFYTKSLTEFLYRKIQNPTFFNVSVALYKAGNEWTEEHEKVYQNFLKQNNIKQ